MYVSSAPFQYIVAELTAAPAAGTGLGTLSGVPVAVGLALAQGLAVGGTYVEPVPTDTAFGGGVLGG